MKWEHWIEVYVGTHCAARGLRSLTIAAYRTALEQFRAYVRFALQDKAPDTLCAREVLEYVQHLREGRGNGDAAVNRHVVVLRNFFRAMVAMGYLPHAANPMAVFPRIRRAPKKLPVTLNAEEIARLLVEPDDDTVIGLRDRAVLALLYGTGIRASECSALTEVAVDLKQLVITVAGKGGHERTVPLNTQVVTALRVYRAARGAQLPGAPFFVSRLGGALTRNAIYERVKTWGRRARIRKPLSPHRLRHTFASHLVREGVGLVTIRDLLGHRSITSTQIYLHVTAHDLRAAAERHPVGRLLGTVADLLPKVRMPFQHAPGNQRYG